MEFKGLGESSSGLELTIATPTGIDLNSLLFESNDDGGNGSNDDENATELDLLKTINHPPPHAGEKAPEDVLTMRGVDVEGDAAGGGSLITRRLYRKLSKEQNDELEAAFQQNNFIDRSSKEALAERLKITLKQVDVWFLNRRCRLRKQQTEEAHIQNKQLVEELTKKKRRLKRKIEKLKKRNKELKEKLKAAATPQAAAPPPPPPSAPSVMLLPLTAGLNDALAAALNTQQGSAAAAAAALPSSGAPPQPPSGGGSSII
ncbi:homeobox-leucine zipper protein HOX3-like [Setaria italica]|uniref:homeobox-leucine zipper protein HOX3-like n=1 Tax=Setaria italica TaxID=4555 RepID=UPI000350AA62|nr:homeobox-leucine zipper protein HOX3-like [Setaria italica]XP_034586511.1 homeobox-leucine zipper protein HOX3-like [Setaria viridis]